MPLPFFLPVQQRTSASSFPVDHRDLHCWAPQGVPPVEDPITAWNAAMQTPLVNVEGHHSNNYASSSEQSRKTMTPSPPIEMRPPATLDEFHPQGHHKKWYYFYEALVEFKEEFGHTQVPLSYKTRDRVARGKWVSRQRQQYSSMKKGLHNSMYPDRLWKLNEIGFDWRGGSVKKVSYPSVMSKNERSAGQGIIACSHSYAQIPENQSRQSELSRTALLDSKSAPPKAENKTTSMAATKPKQQKNLGFFWDAFLSSETAIEDRNTKPITMEGLVTKALEARRRAVADSSSDFPPQGSPVTASASSSSEASATSRLITVNESNRFATPRNMCEDTWMSQYQALVTYQEQNGHTRVPSHFMTKEGFSLGAWVNKLRVANGKRQRGQPNTMCPDRLRMLNDIGFEWQGGERNRRDDKWDSKFKAIVEFKEQFGHTQVPKCFVTKDGVPLGSWVMNQRTEYRRRAKGLKHHMYPERLQLLQEIGFDLDGPRSRRIPGVKIISFEI